MKIAILSDLHWGVRNDSPFFMDKMEEFYYNSFIPYLKENNINTIWILGDIFENRKSLNVQTMHRVKNFFGTLEEENMTVYCISGNHDLFFKNTNSIGSLDPLLSQFPNVKLIQKFDVVEFDSVPVGFISWISHEIREEALQWIKTVDTTILCGHFEIQSFEVIKGVLCKSGLTPELFDRFDLVFSGHFHVRANRGVIHYVGNPYQTNWSEAGTKKGFHIFDVNTREIQFIENPVSVYDVIQYTDELQDYDYESYRNKIIRVFAVETVTNRQKFELFIDELTHICQSVEVIDDKSITVTEETLPLNDTMDTIKKYLDNCDIKDFDKVILERALLEIYHEAKEREWSC